MVGKSKLVFLLATLFFGVTLLSLPIIQVTEVVMDNTVYLIQPNVKVTVALEYLHSVELMKVVETYEVVGCEVRLVKLVWPGHGAGLPSTPNDLPVQIVGSDGGYTAEDISLGPVVMVSMRHRVDPTLTLNGKRVTFNGTVEIKACVRVPPVALLLQAVLGSVKGLNYIA
ncbi:MAG: DUF1850 domain-containing protein [Zestosphaera sp.]